jgi:hypothetical protein
VKDMGEASYIIGIKLLRDRKQRMLGSSQSVYIDKIQAKFSMDQCKEAIIPFRHGLILSSKQCPQIQEEKDRINRIPYASVLGSLMYTIFYTRPDICFAVHMVSRYQSNLREVHWQAVKHILKYL